ncbi:MAG: hypothetical protein ABI273_09970, partial [Lacunisphaera sp.]
MPRFPKIFLLSVLAVLLAFSARAAESPTVAGPLTREVFINKLSTNFTAHFNLEGDLQLELLREWSAPDRVAREWTLDITEYPALASSAMLTRCRVLADGKVAGEYTITMHASLWREAWSARQPIAANSTFEPAELEVRRVDFLRERDALPTAVGDHSFI